MVSLGDGFQDPCWCQKLEDKQIYFRFVLLHFFAPCKYCGVCLFLRNWRLVTALYQARLSALFFQQHLLISCLCHILVILTIPPAFSLLLCLLSEKALAPHSSTLAWKIPWTEESSRLQSMGSLRVVSLSLFPFMHWRRKWQPTPVFLPGESQGRRSLVGCRLWGRTGSDMTEAT